MKDTKYTLVYYIQPFKLLHAKFTIHFQNVARYLSVQWLVLVTSWDMTPTCTKVVYRVNRLDSDSSLQ